MTLATVIIQEANTVSQTLTTCTSSNMGILDTPNTALATAYAIPADSYSYEKWQKVTVTVNADSNTIKGIRVWRTGTLGGGSDTHLANCKTSAYVGAPSFRTPIITVSDLAINAMPTADPAATNLGIGGSLTGEITTTGSSDYCVHQIHVHSSTVAGPAAANTLYFQYDEYA
jgi:hypothetical protein